MKVPKSLLATTMLAGMLLANPAIANPAHLESIIPTPLPGVIDAWVYVDYPMSVRCQGHGCYAKSQWILARVHCFAGFWLPLTRVSLDLNGNVVGVAHGDPTGRFVRPQGPGGDAVFYRLCGGVPDGPVWRDRDRYDDRVLR